MNRRDALAAGVSLAALAAAGKAFAVPPCPPDLSGTQLEDCSQLSALPQWDWNVPSLQDETDFYTNVLGWTIPAGEPNFDNTFGGSYDWDTPPAFGFGSLHYDTENDDLWMWDQQNKRYGASFVVNGDTVADWRAQVLAEYKANLLSSLDASEDLGVLDHPYGRGLCTIYHDTNDATILPILDGLRTRIEATSSYSDFETQTPSAVFKYGGRAVARQASTAAYAVEATQNGDWITMRDNFVIAFAQATDWQDYTDTPIMAPGTGMFFGSRSPNFSNNINVAGSSYGTALEAYDDGYRFNSTFQIGLAAEAMWRLYVQTGNTIIRDRLIKMARYVQYYALDPSWNYPNVGSYFGHTNTGDRWWTRDIVHTRADGTLAIADTDCSYDASLINVMVMGYKLTGEQSMLDKARVFFSRCNRWLPGPNDFKAASENHLLKYMDTTPNNGHDKMQWNKGVLQYGYQVFENGGNPSALV